MKLFENIFTKKIEELKQDATEAVEDIEENHPVFLYGGLALVSVMGVVIISQKFQINCYKIVNDAQSSRVVVVK